METSEEKREQENTKEEQKRELNVPVKYNPETGKYEADNEELNKRVEEMNKQSGESGEKQEEPKETNQEQNNLVNEQTQQEQKSEEPGEPNKSSESGESDKQSESGGESKEEKPKEKPQKKSSKKGKEGSFKPMILIMVFSLVVASLWEKIPAIKKTIHAGLDPTAGVLLDWNMHLGMLLIIIIITVITTLVQKYGTDQETLREIKKEQKSLQKEMKKHRSDPNKTMELQKQQMKLMPKQMKLSMRGIVYTGVPFILLVRWFHDYFKAAGDPQFFGFMGWIWFYLLGAVIIGSILRKWWNVV